MTLIDEDKNIRLECFSCGHTSFDLKDRSRIFENINGKSKPTNNWEVLLQCRNCLYSVTKRFDGFHFEDRLIKFLRQQRIIGNKKIKNHDGYWVQERWAYPYDESIKGYRLDKPFGYNRR